MKLFSPLYAAALALAVSMGSIDMASAVSCAENCDDCLDASSDQSSPLVISKTDTSAACADGTFAYVESFRVGSIDGSEIYVSFLDNPDVTADGDCDFTYDTPIGPSTPSDIDITVHCATPIDGTQPSCPVLYKVVWACTEAASDPNAAVETCTGECGDADGCKTASVPTSLPTTVTQDPACAAGQRSFLTSLVVVPTDGSSIEVSFSSGVGAMPASESCATKFTVGDSDEQVGDASYTVTCTTATSGSACAIRSKATWDCIDKTGTSGSGSATSSASGSDSNTTTTTKPPITPGPTTVKPVTATTGPSPSPTTTTSGIASMGGATPVVVAVALVAVIGGVNFMMPT